MQERIFKVGVAQSTQQIVERLKVVYIVYITSKTFEVRDDRLLLNNSMHKAHQAGGGQHMR